MGVRRTALCSCGSQVLFLACAVVAALILGALPSQASADELADVREQIDQKLSQLDQLKSDVVSARKRIDKLNGKMQRTLGEISQKQAESVKLNASMSSMAVELYKDRESYNPLFIIQSSESLGDVLWRLDMRERVLERYADVSEEVKEAARQLDLKYQEVSEAKNEQVQLVGELKKKRKQLDKTIAELRKQEKILSVTEQEQLAQAAAAAGMVADTFETGTIGDDEIEWQTGLASAYGGESDKMTKNPAKTATGTICDDWSVGVAVPMTWDTSQYYGRYVEISYDGRSIIAPVVDCGDMDGGRRALDLQPGVFKAFGCYTCDDWGVREVLYRFL